MRNKIISVIFVMLMVFSLFSITAFAQTGDVVISAESVDVKAGEKFELPLKVTKNSGVWGFGIEVHYDKDAMTYDSIKYNSNFAESDFMVNATKSGVIVLIYNYSDIQANNNNTGNLVTLVFKTDKKAVNGNYDVRVSLTSGGDGVKNVPSDSANNGVGAVSLGFESAIVKISGGAKAPVTTKPVVNNNDANNNDANAQADNNAADNENVQQTAKEIGGNAIVDGQSQSKDSNSTPMTPVLIVIIIIGVAVIGVSAFALFKMKNTSANGENNENAEDKGDVDNTEGTKEE